MKTGKLDNSKVVMAFMGFCLLFGIVLSKACWIQVLNNKELLERGKKQIFRTSKVYPYRGNIYDRNGSPLALNIQTYSIVTVPGDMKDENHAYKQLSKIVPKLSYQRIMKRIHNRTKFTFLARKISLTKKQVVLIKGLNGIYLESVPKRIYPNHELLSQALGFVGIDNVGLAGLEYLFDEELKGKPRITKYISDAKGRPIKFESEKIDGEAKDIYLSIDKELQAMAEKALHETVEKYKAKMGGIGVMDVATGELLAVANYPTYDSNMAGDSPAVNRKLSFVTDPIEPGSIFKVLTIASALENGIARPDTNYYCERGRFKVGNHTISEAEQRKKYEWLSLSEIIQFSSNIGTTKVAFDLTFPRLKHSLEMFNIGKKTGIEIPGESRGIFSVNKNVSPLSLSNISFGQGVATTGIQILSAYAAIVNRGIYMPPTIIKDSNRLNQGIRVISKQTSDELIQMLVQVVENGTGGRAKIPHFKIAGKTSTAQRPAKNRGYDGYIPGFVGFPVNIENKFVIYVYVDDPKEKEYYGNIVAAPVFKKVAEYMLYRNKKFDHLAIEKGKHHKDVFDSVEIRQSATRLLKKGVMPNFIGLDRRSATGLLKKLEVRFSESGIGVVVSQRPVAGTKLGKYALINLVYSPPLYE